VQRIGDGEVQDRTRNVDDHAIDQPRTDPDPQIRGLGHPESGLAERGLPVTRRSLPVPRLAILRILSVGLSGTRLPELLLGVRILLGALRILLIRLAGLSRLPVRLLSVGLLPILLPGLIRLSVWRLPRLPVRWLARLPVGLRPGL